SRRGDELDRTTGGEFGTHGCGKIALLGDRDRVELEPARELAELRRELPSGASRGVLLGPRGLHEQPPSGAVGLEVHARRDVLAYEEGQAVVAVLPLVGWRVDLDPVVHAEELEEPSALPHEWVERAQQRAAARSPHPGRITVQ